VAWQAADPSLSRVAYSAARRPTSLPRRWPVTPRSAPGRSRRSGHGRWRLPCRPCVVIGCGRSRVS